MTSFSTGSHSRDLDLSELLDGIVAGDVVLPNFQRDFDWNEPDVVSLLATVLRGWPAGSLLIMDGKPTFFDVREFEDAPPVSPMIRRVVLDGQQRLTSLFHAFRGAGPKVYALKVDRVLVEEPSPEDLEDALVVMTREQFESERSAALVREGKLVPLFVATSAADFYEWRDQIVDGVDLELRSEINERLGQVYKHVLSKANRYKFPAMLLDTDLEPSAIARIFERINRTGMRLSTFDLLVARSYTKHWNLREVWQEAREELAHLDQFLGEDGLMVAQTLSLREYGDVRQPAVLKMPSDLVQDKWEETVLGVQTACDFLVKTGVLNGTWLPYRTQLLPIAALAVEFDLRDHADLLRGWFWGSSLSLGYEVASSTVAADDYNRLRNCAAGTASPPHYEVSRRTLVGATRRQQAAIWRAMRALLVHHAAKDLVSGELVHDLPEESLTTLSLFPRMNIEASPHLLVLSQFLAEKPSVRALRSRPLATRTRSELEDLPLDSQFLSVDALTGGPGWEAVLDRRVDEIEDFLVPLYAASITFVE